MYLCRLEASFIDRVPGQSGLHEKLCLKNKTEKCHRTINTVWGGGWRLYPSQVRHISLILLRKVKSVDQDITTSLDCMRLCLKKK